MAKRTLLPYQARWVQDKSGFKVIEKSRRIGLSWAEAYDAVLYAGTSKGGGNVYYQSFAYDMTRGFIGDCADWAKFGNIPAQAVGETLINIDDSQIPAFKLPLANGREILAMTSAPRGFRSKGRPGDLAIIDEAAFVDHLDEVLKAALAFRMWGGHVHIISTHNGETSPFSRLVREVREGTRPGSLHTVTLADALADGLYRRICAIQGISWSSAAEAQWEARLRAEYGANAGEELDCIPSTGGGAWLAWHLIRQAEHGDAGQPEHYAGHAVYMGIDIARRNDLWVAAVLERLGDVLWLRELRVESNISFTRQHEIVDELVLQYKPVRIAADQTGMGEAVVEAMQDRHGRHRVEGVLLTAPRRLDVATALREVIEDQRLRLPADEVLRRDLHSIKSESGLTGAPRLVANRKDTDGHADRFWALALACAAAATKVVPAAGATVNDDEASIRAVYTPSALRGRRRMGGRRRNLVGLRRSA